MTDTTSKPFIIWTMRRTGGTTFANLLMDLSRWPRVIHEPFNYDRAFGEVSRRWYENRDLDRTRADLDRTLSPKPLIKHCHEIHGRRFNRLLLEATLRHAYAHIELRRRNEVDRLLSLQLAQITGVWGKMGSGEVYRRILAGEAGELRFDIEAALEHMEKCALSTRRIRSLLKKAGVPLLTVWFEDLYSDLQRGRQVVAETLAFLEFDETTFGAHSAEIGEALLTKGQNSARILDKVVNIDEARARLTEKYRELEDGAA